MDTQPDRTGLLWNVLRRTVSMIKTRPETVEFLLLVAMVSYLLAIVVFGIDVPGSTVLRPVFGFILLTVLPGYLLVSLLGLGDHPAGRIAIYSVGLSLPVVTFLSIAVNFVVPVFTTVRPLSPRTLTVAASALVLGLSAVRAINLGSSQSLQPMGRIRGWKFERDGPVIRSLWQQMPLSGYDWITVLLLTLLLVCTVLVTVLTGTRGFDWMLIALLCSLSVVPIVLWVWQRSPALYPYAIWVVSAAVLLQMTLVSSHLWGWDIHYQYFMAARIFENGSWNPGFPYATNSLVTVTLLAAVYSMVTGIDLVLVYKLCYPLFVSLLPVGIWYIAREEFTDHSVAVFAPFVLVFYYGFFKNMPDKQLVAGLFAVLMLMAFLDSGLSTTKRWILGLVFAIGLVVSHYGVSLLFIAFLCFALIARYVVRVVLDIEVAARITRVPLVGFLSVFWAGWYSVTASGLNFHRAVRVGFLVLEAFPIPTRGRNGAAYATMEFESIYWLTYKLMYIVLVGLIGLGIVGALYLLVTDRKSPEAAEYVLLSVGVFGVLCASFVFTFAMGFDRVLEISLFVLAPFAIVGAMALLSCVSWLAARLPPSGLRARVDAIPIRGLFAVFLALLFLFSSGTVFALADQPLPAYNINLDKDAGWPVYTQSEVEATRWLQSHIDDNATIAVYSTLGRTVNSRDGLLLQELFRLERLKPIWVGKTTLYDSTYVYVSHKPVLNLDSDTRYDYIDVRETPLYKQTLSEAKIVFSNDKVTIYYVSVGGETVSYNQTEPKTSGLRDRSPTETNDKATKRDTRTSQRVYGRYVHV